MNVLTEPYLTQTQRWPQSGQHILAQFDDETIIVYQAYSAEIASFAVTHGYLGGGFSMNRMSWIKPNFLWMMFRSGWASKAAQEHVLAVRITRSGFEAILAQAVHSSYQPDLYPSLEAWKQAGSQSDVRLQWDPDHDPTGRKLQRRALQLGLSGETLAKYVHQWTVEIQDITDFVHEQSQSAQPARFVQLSMPKEEVYPILDGELRRKLGVALPNTTTD